MRALLLVLIIGMLGIGCAERWREAKAGKSNIEIGDQIAELRASGSGTPGLEAALALGEDPNSFKYYIEAPGVSGSPTLVAPLDYAFVGNGWGQVSNIKNIRVYYFDRLVAGGHEVALILQMEHVTHGKQIRVYLRTTANATANFPLGNMIDDDTFEVILAGPVNSAVSGGNQYLILQTNDIQNGDLAPVVQFDVRVVDQGMFEFSIGRISSLVGFF